MYSAFMQYNEVFITGGTGLLGRHVCRALIGRGFLPRLPVRTGSEGWIVPDVRERCRVIPGDLTVRESVEMGGTRSTNDPSPAPAPPLSPCHRGTEPGPRDVPPRR